ncbi:lipid-A-disaccharide synthase-related protein [Cyanobium sp. Morenito 9A2]|uniref:lipid-A-disaccharide synthase-related protein n=1 Tax=Cyanobium sp. Morenito 9A2 TaxID=2823718 RepID=UPI0020CC35FF|nr:lipid-A-disaccharide synthase-related protein [Cyanobium sp. Morenito 9A2]MCP9850589.1 lipid-A-disaccharide synthase-related protein [Cyanobium sp. Morenito 9A2]
MPSRLLVLSNGHGEDAIAVRIIAALHQRRPDLELAVLPLVGEGEAFAALEAQGILSRIGPRQRLPSGGFSNQSLRGLGRDLAAGLPLLSWRQWRLVRHWGASGQPLLAVGDVLPLLLAAASGAPFGFIGTPKSDFTWRSGPGRALCADAYHRLKGSEWDPWEWALMGLGRCRLVAVRDALTARGLRRHRVHALAPGNPMMDGLDPAAEFLPPSGASRRVLLLMGSRTPEALGNLQRLLGALLRCPQPMEVRAACGSQPREEAIAGILQRLGLERCPVPAGSSAVAAWRHQQRPLRFLLGRGNLAEWARSTELAVATAGTATEQVVGLGCPALSLPGPGPQFKAAFARRQSRLLGGAVRVCAGSAELAEGVEQLLADGALRERLGRLGRRRMGAPGGSARIASAIDRVLLGPPGQDGIT